MCWKVPVPQLYRRRSGWLPFVEIAIGAISCSCTDFAIQTLELNFLLLSLLLSFVS